jgi:hypothetical protein
LNSKLSKKLSKAIFQNLFHTEKWPNYKLNKPALKIIATLPLELLNKIKFYFSFVLSLNKNPLHLNIYRGFSHYLPLYSEYLSNSFIALLNYHCCSTFAHFIGGK